MLSQRGCELWSEVVDKLLSQPGWLLDIAGTLRLQHRPFNDTMNASGESYSIRRLATLFAAWKCLVISLAFASPGPGYDTSTGILFDQYASASVSKTWLARILDHLTLRLTRWDGLYFAVNAERGHVNEQDWAFSWALARFTDAAAEG